MGAGCCVELSAREGATRAIPSHQSPVVPALPCQGSSRNHTNVEEEDHDEVEDLEQTSPPIPTMSTEPKIDNMQRQRQHDEKLDDCSPSLPSPPPPPLVAAPPPQNQNQGVSFLQHVFVLVSDDGHGNPKSTSEHSSSSSCSSSSSSSTSPRNGNGSDRTASPASLRASTLQTSSHSSLPALTGRITTTRELEIIETISPSRQASIIAEEDANTTFQSPQAPLNGHRDTTALPSPQSLTSFLESGVSPTIPLLPLLAPLGARHPTHLDSPRQSSTSQRRSPSNSNNTSGGVLYEDDISFDASVSSSFRIAPLWDLGLRQREQIAVPRRVRMALNNTTASSTAAANVVPPPPPALLVTMQRGVAQKSSITMSTSTTSFLVAVPASSAPPPRLSRSLRDGRGGGDESHVSATLITLSPRRRQTTMPHHDDSAERRCSGNDEVVDHILDEADATHGMNNSSTTAANRWSAIHKGTNHRSHYGDDADDESEVEIVVDTSLTMPPKKTSAVRNPFHVDQRTMTKPTTSPGAEAFAERGPPPTGDDHLSRRQRSSLVIETDDRNFIHPPMRDAFDDDDDHDEAEDVA